MQQRCVGNSDSYYLVVSDSLSELERIVLKTLRKDRDERYKSAQDLLADLKQLKRDSDFNIVRKRTASSVSESDKKEGIFT